METKLEQIAVKAVNQLPRAWCGKSARHVLWEPGAGDRLRRPGRCENGDMVEPVRHRRTKGAETDMFEPKATASHLDSTKMRRTQSEQNASASPPIADIQTGPGLPSLRAKRRRHSGAISSRIRSCGHLLRDRSKSNDDFGCLLTGANNIIERLPRFLQIWRVSAQPV